eukprot:2883073-Rhodomonas_salina.2
MRPDADRWLKAEETEMATCYEKGTFKIVDLPDGVVELPSMFQYKLKTGPNCETVKCKARLCARRDLQFDSEYSETFAPTSQFFMIRLIIAIAVQNGLKLYQFDIKGAFLCAPIDREIYLKLPPGYTPPPGKTACLRKSLYGLKQAPSAFHGLFETWLLKYGFKPIGGDRVTFLYCEGTSVILLQVSIYMDDGISACNNKELYQLFLTDLGKDFELSNQGPVSWYLGVCVKQDLTNKRTTLSQEQYVKDVLELFGMTGATPVSMQMEANTHLTSADCPPPHKVDKQFKQEYQRIVGSLMYLLCFTCPDLAFSVNQCSRFMSNPGPLHMAAASQILWHLAGTAHHGITYKVQPKSRENLLWGFADADHAGDPDTRKSVTGYVTMLCCAAISWASNLQAVVALSSSEAEFYAASASGCNISYFRNILVQLGLEQKQPTIVFEDNWECIHLSCNAVLHHKSKHINVRVYHLRDLCKLGIMNLLKIRTESMVADTLTKLLQRPAFEEH